MLASHSSQQNKEKTQSSNNSNSYLSVKEGTTKYILDNKYEIFHTLGEGRYARVRLGLQLNKQKLVAIKILKESEVFSKHHNLECLFNEVNILTNCDHPNIGKILEAQFNGTILKESKLINKDTQATEITKSIEQQNVCYCVLKLAKYGELFTFIEHTDRFSEKFSRTLFLQLIKGLTYLHSSGIMHRDIKPENLLIDSKFRLVIVDFGFAYQLEKSELNKLQNDEDQYFIKKCRLGSEEYNPPELNFDENLLNEHKTPIEISKAQNQGSSNVHSPNNANSSNNPDNYTMKYDGFKADIFSAATTLFLMVMRSPPFRKAHIKDQFFKRLCAADKKQFWNIFKNIPSSQDFKDFFERLSRKNPDERLSLAKMQSHAWFQGEIMTQEDIQIEVEKRYQYLSNIKQSNTTENQQTAMIQLNSQQDLLDLEKFESLRQQLIVEIEKLNKKIVHRKGMSKIKKQMNHMMADPLQTAIYSPVYYEQQEVFYDSQSKEQSSNEKQSKQFSKDSSKSQKNSDSEGKSKEDKKKQYYDQQYDRNQLGKYSQEE